MSPTSLIFLFSLPRTRTRQTKTLTALNIYSLIFSVIQQIIIIVIASSNDVGDLCVVDVPLKLQLLMVTRSVLQ